MNDSEITRSAPQAVEVVAPTRLHFGLLRVGDGERRFGGAGVMLDEPRLRIACRNSESFQCCGPLAERVSEFAARWSRFHERQQPAVTLEVVEAPPQHSGLGVGTQLGLSVAAALNACCDRPPATPEVLARSVERGNRSAVGAYGFHLGGLIIERGKTKDETLSPLDLHVDLPAEWRFLQVRPGAEQAALHGEREQDVFAKLVARPELEDQLEAILRERLAPAALQGDFMQFANAVHDYGRRAGEYFAAAQGGSYNGPLLNWLVEQLRRLGAQGVAQSSWGPTLFCCSANAADAETLAAEINKLDQFGPLDVRISRVSRHGASVQATCMK